MAQHETRPPMTPRARETTAVRQGVTLGVMRYVLLVSLVLAIAALGGLWFAFGG
ncbi:hypothetical protein ROS9278_00489 [Roseomonas sp. CECT 9278]|nr:hypothetical protein ROS9278_00489 [Roseomonas sp. CECT 9278]